MSYACGRCKNVSVSNMASAKSIKIPTFVNITQMIENKLMIIYHSVEAVFSRNFD